jgi:uncharacterized C2H2 Zn-finger protein
MKGRWRKYPSKMGKTLKECPKCGFTSELKKTHKSGESAWIYYTEFYPCPKCGYIHHKR